MNNGTETSCKIKPRYSLDEQTSEKAISCGDGWNTEILIRR